MFLILVLLLSITSVLGQPVQNEEELFEGERKFLAVAQCEAIYEYMCPSGLCTVLSARNRATKQEDDWRPAQHFCDAACMRDAGCRTICTCANQRVENVNPFPARLEQQVLSDPVLHCRESSFMSMKWNYSGSEELVIFAVEIRDFGDLHWKPYTLTRDNITVINGLLPRQKYRFRIFAVGPSGIIGRPTISELISTLPAFVDFASGMIDLDSPSNLQQLSRTQYTANGAVVRLGWKPGKHTTCSYQLKFTSVRGDGGMHLVMPQPLKFSVTETPMEIELEDLNFNDTYTFAMESRLDGYDVESDPSTAAEMAPLITKDCLSVFNHNLSICLPRAPTDLHIQVVDTGNDTAQVSVSWARVEGHPTGYNVSLYGPNYRLINFTLVSGTATLATFENVPLETYYVTEVRAFAPSGLGAHAEKSSVGVSGSSKSPASIATFTDPTPTNNASSISLSKTNFKPAVSVKRTETYEHLWIYLSFGGGLGVCIIGALLSFVLSRCSSKIRKILEVPQCRATILEEPKFVPGPEPEPEPEPELHLHERIGEGAFGTVWSGFLREPFKDPIEVAVKMLKENPSKEDSDNFDKEMTILKSVNPHPNVIRLIACVTQSPEKKIIMEYCKLGDLQKFLDTAWIELTRRPCEDLTSSNVLTATTSKVSDRVKFSRLLVSFARQIAAGMEFLTESGIVHRDLAARNILIAGDGTIRISDFGLSREVVETRVYLKRGHEPVPYKWVAPEAAQNKVFSSKSDVWSYGITLWEIVTLGSSPYAFICDASSYMKYLLSGARMPRPCNCSVDLYEWMLRCWDKDPDSRPTFQLLREHMENLEHMGGELISLNRHKIHTFSCMRPIKFQQDHDGSETEESVAMG